MAVLSKEDCCNSEPSCTPKVQVLAGSWRLRARRQVALHKRLILCPSSSVLQLTGRAKAAYTPRLKVHLFGGRQLPFARKALAFWTAVPGRAHCHALPRTDQEDLGEGAAELDVLTEAETLARLQDLSRRRLQVRSLAPGLDALTNVVALTRLQVLVPVPARLAVAGCSASVQCQCFTPLAFVLCCHLKAWDPPCKKVALSGVRRDLAIASPVQSGGVLPAYLLVRAAVLPHLCSRA